MRRTRIAQPHLEYRPTGFHWRRRWPAAWRRMATGTTARPNALLFPLRTHVLFNAKHASRALTSLTDTAFTTRMELVMAIAPEIMDRLLVELCRCLVEASDLARELAPARSPEAAAYEHACGRAAIETLQQAIFLRDREIARNPLREVAARLGIALDEEDPGWQRLALRALRVMIDAKEEELRRDQGQFTTTSPEQKKALMLVDGITANQASGEVLSHSPDLISEPPKDQSGGAAPPNQTPVARSRRARVSPGPGPKATRLDKRPAILAGKSTGQPPPLSLAAAFDLYIAKKRAGYSDDFGEDELPDPAAGEKWW